MTIKKFAALLLMVIIAFSILASCGADDNPEENGAFEQAPTVEPVEMETVSVSTPPEEEVVVNIEIPPTDDKQSLELLLPDNSYSLYSNVIPYSIVNDTGKHAEVLLIPILEKETDSGWEKLAPEGVGFCGTPDPVDTQREGELPLEWYASSLTVGRYRLSFEVVESSQKIETVSAVFELDESEPPLPYEIGSLTVISDGIEYKPYLHFLYAAVWHEPGGTLFADGIPIDFEKISGGLPTIQYESGFRLVIEGKDASVPEYSLYDENFECIYSRAEDFTLPEEAGEYLLGVDITWQAASDNKKNPQYTGYRYFFKVRVS